MITSQSARIAVNASRGESAWADIHQICSGYAVAVSFTPRFGGAFYVAHNKGDPRQRAIIVAPSDKWAGDITDSGWVIDQKIEGFTEPVSSPLQAREEEGKE